jgi:hypothetical protein
MQDAVELKFIDTPLSDAQLNDLIRLVPYSS